MSIIANGKTRVAIQGLTGSYARLQTQAMLDAGTTIAAGVTPGRGGTQVLGLPVYDSMAEATRAHGVDASVVYAPPPQALNAVWEALESGVRTVIVAAEGVPLKDATFMRQLAQEHNAWLVGPNTIGLISPGQTLLGSFPKEYALQGSIGIVARSGSLAIEVMRVLTAGHLGQSTVVAVGGDPVIGQQLEDYLSAFEADPGTDLMIYLGELGGLKEHTLASHIAEYTKPVIAYIAGKCAPPNKRMGHVGAVVYGQQDTADAKEAALQEAGAHVASTPWDIPGLAETLLPSPNQSSDARRDNAV